MSKNVLRHWLDGQVGMVMVGANVEEVDLQEEG